MSEKKCPCCGSIVMVLVKGTMECFKCQFVCAVKDFPRIAAAMELAKARAAYESADGTTHKDEEICEMWDDVTNATKRVLEVFNG